MRRRPCRGAWIGRKNDCDGSAGKWPEQEEKPDPGDCRIEHRPGHLTSGIAQRIEKSSELHTDEHSDYVGLEEEYTHEVVSHAADEYVRGHVTTNGIENFWALLKRTIKGSYVSVEPFHLHRYLDEQAFRFNGRGGKDPDRFCYVARTHTGERLTYQKLAG